MRRWRRGRAEQQSGRRPRSYSLGGPGADELQLVVGIDVMTGDRATHDDPIAPMVLDERELAGPRRVRRVRRRKRAFGTAGVLEPITANSGLWASIARHVDRCQRGRVVQIGLFAPTGTRDHADNLDVSLARASL